MNHNNFILREKNGLKYYTIESFDKYNIKHMFTTRVGGCSKGAYSSLNMGIGIAEDINAVIKNNDRVLEIFNTDKNNLYISKQVHGDNIIAVDNLNNDDYTILREKGVDGLVTDAKNKLLCCYFADCVPLFFLDPSKMVVGVAHAGWRGTVNGIAGKMIDVMKEKYNSNASDILVGIGPSIGPCCFEVKEDVFDVFAKKIQNISEISKQITSDKWLIDLWKVNKILLKEKGVLDRNITISSICTFCNEDLLYSYRRDKGKTGRMAALIRL
ncbi:peptidoglycan editing factor PgeF [Abyssisolibacter fermentans]|uniref:peptidoglycan editing factor PgeF n=1 Tax=Abyssisolibacter fermentans TaxID=1766203 RepID=UPI000A768C3F|nr:peptidoglycan editing factor PgeF [Abyssisolibacter fermentans]